MGGCWVPIKKQRGQGWGLTLMSCIKALLNYCLWKTYSQCCYLPHGTILVIRPKLANLEEVNKEMDSYPALLLLSDEAVWRKSGKIFTQCPLF